jgi:hypothetical protein
MAPFFAALYGAFPASMLISVGLFRLTWLEMQVNMGWVFFALWVLFTIILLKWGRFLGICRGVRRALANLLVCGAGCLLLLGTSRITVVPASIIREGLMLPRLPFAHVNAGIGAFLFFGCVALCRLKDKNKAGQRVIK